MKLQIIILLILCCISRITYSQDYLQGTVLNQAKEKLKRVTIFNQASNKRAISDNNGTFRIEGKVGDKLRFTSIGYQPLEIIASNLFDIYELSSVDHAVEEVSVNTGYYKAPRERMTGSFGVISNKDLERGTSSTLLERIEGLATGVHLNKFNTQGEANKKTNSFSIRGLSTIESNAEPLIILDDIPYSGSLETIDPNNIESITILKDATAASIWGARAGNGVLVITTKKGKFGQPTLISFRSSLEIGDKPDLFYDKSYLPSTTVMEFEKILLNRKSYPERNQTVIPLYVEYLIAARPGGNLTEAELAIKEEYLRLQDTRQSALDHLYRKSIEQQYALNVSGGSTNYAFSVAGAWNKDKETVIGNSNDRKTITLNNAFRIWNSLEINATGAYTVTRSKNNGIKYSDLSIPTYKISPYLNLLDEDGNPNTMPYGFRSSYQDTAPALGLLDWRYRPLDERELNDNRMENQEVRFNISARQKLFKGANIQLLYNYRRSIISNSEHAFADSYFARNLVNRFTQSNGVRVIPLGGVISEAATNNNYDNTGRIQINYALPSSDKHDWYSLIGAEIRSAVIETSPLTRLYGFDDDLKVGTSKLNFNQTYPTRPTGSAAITLPLGSYSLAINRFLSYFGNSSYTNDNKYTLSTSVRWDGSNIYGVKANQKGIPLWSVGGSWNLSEESFFHSTHIDYLRLRATYGSSGNSNTSVSTYPTVIYDTDTETGLRSARLRNPGNPSIKWERVNITNLGLDFRMLKNRISGSIEYFVKHSEDLIGDQYLDPTQGLSPGFLPVLNNKVNYATMRTQGWDIELRSKNLVGPFQWNTTLMFSSVRDKVTKYQPSTQNDTENITVYFYQITRPPVRVGESLNTLYAFPWFGLDELGSPYAIRNGELIKDYQDYHNNFPADQLIKAGVRVAPYFGSVRNDFSWRNIDASFLVLWKAGHVFRRTSMGAGDEYRNAYHTDYFLRWQNPGDEVHTNVPAAIPVDKVNDHQVLSKNNLYMNSEALITPASFVRLQDISLGYTFRSIHRVGIKELRFFAQAKNLGLLWQNNKLGYDPEYPNALYPPTRTISFGLNASF